MGKLWRWSGLLLCVMMLTCVWCQSVQAAEEETIKTGVYAGELDLSGKTAEEAKSAIAHYVSELENTELTFMAGGGNPVKVKAGELGITWANTDLPQEAMAVGRTGNIIERYKLIKDLENQSMSLPIKLDFDVEAINTVLVEECEQYNNEPTNVSLVKGENGEFQVVDGKPGSVLDVEASIDKVYVYLTEEWNQKPGAVELAIVTKEPKGSAEELADVTDLLGSFTTSYRTSGTSRSRNVEAGVALINGAVLYPGEEFSTYGAVSPFTEENGYYMADSYLNGRVVQSLGGGICQVSTTLYNAVLRAELEVTERHNHSMIVAYVDPSADAAIAESAGKDFKFVNNYDYPIYIEGITENKQITINIYGKETRPENRTVEYKSEVLEVIHPTTDAIYTDPGQPIGYIVVENAHTGYKARLWKVVKENGVEVSREQVNSSSYRVSPRSATVGTATADPNAYNEIMAAVGTSNIDHVRNVIGILTAPPAPVEEDDDDD